MYIDCQIKITPAFIRQALYFYYLLVSFVGNPNFFSILVPTKYCLRIWWIQIQSMDIYFILHLFNLHVQELFFCKKIFSFFGIKSIQFCQLSPLHLDRISQKSVRVMVRRYNQPYFFVGTKISSDLLCAQYARVITCICWFSNRKINDWQNNNDRNFYHPLSKWAKFTNNDRIFIAHLISGLNLLIML